MLNEGKIWVGTGDDAQPVYLLPQMANRHGLIAGATGTGKTVTLKVLAEGFSKMGVPVFMGDIKGDLSGMIRCGTPNDKIAERLSVCGVTDGFAHQSYPTVFWDVYGEQGHPVRTTVHEMGAMLLSRMLNLNETQAGVLNILFRVSAAENLPLITVQDVRAMLVHIGDHAADYTLNYGNISKASVGAIQRALALLEDQGGDVFFGEPSLKISDWMQTSEDGKGTINILACDRLFQNPLMYSTFLLWMLTELYDSMPEVGDLDKPRMVFFFDEAHLLFDDCPKQLMEKIEQIVRLIRSKGVGVYFITQNPSDVPSNVLSQLNNRVQHALRAYTPLDQKGVKVAAQTFRANPAFSTEAAISRLKTGEALVSFLDEHGAPSIVSRATILPPESSMSAITPQERKQFIEASPLYGRYEQLLPQKGAYAQLNETAAPETEAPAQDSALVEAFKRYATAGSAYLNSVFDFHKPDSANEPPNVPTLSQTRAELNAAASSAAYEQSIPPIDILLEDPTLSDNAYQEKECIGMTNDNNNNAQALQLQIQQLQAQLQQQQLQQQQLLQQLQQQAAAQPAPAQFQPVMPQAAAPAMQPVVPVQPAMPAQPAAAIMADQAQTVQQTVMVLDPESGAYVQKTLTMIYDAATGKYYPVQTEKEAKAAAAAKEKAERDAIREEKAKEAEARRVRAAELREESAARARANNSVLGRVKNTAVQSATRTVTNSLTKSLMNFLGGKKK